MKFRKVPIAILLLTLLLVTAGCKDKYRKAALASRDVAVAVQSLQKTEIALHDQHQLDDAEHKSFQDAFLQVAQTGMEVNKVIRAGNSASDKQAQALIDQAFASTQNLLDNGVGNIKNAQTKAALSASVLGIRTLVTQIAIALELKGATQ